MNKVRSKILPPLITVAALLIGLVITNKLREPFYVWADPVPIPRKSVMRQFAAQVQSQMAGRQVTIHETEIVTLENIVVDETLYNAQRNEYIIHYSLYWSGPSRSMFGRECSLASSGSNSFSGSCSIEEYPRGGAVPKETVAISVR